MCPHICITVCYNPFIKYLYTSYGLTLLPNNFTLYKNKKQVVMEGTANAEEERSSPFTV